MAKQLTLEGTVSAVTVEAQEVGADRGALELLTWLDWTGPVAMLLRHDAVIAVGPDNLSTVVNRLKTRGIPIRHRTYYDLRGVWLLGIAPAHLVRAQRALKGVLE